MVSNFLNTVATLSLILICSATAIAQQTDDNSPYSRFGLGDLAPQNLTVVNTMGLHAAYNSIYDINIVNPASYGHLRLTSYDVGAFSQYSRLSTDTENLDVWKGNLTNITIAFPFFNPLNKIASGEQKPYEIGMVLGLKPYSTVNYNTLLTDSIVGAGDILYNYQGTGGLYRVFTGFGINYKNFSAGVNLGYIFGKTENVRQVSFPDLTQPFVDVLDGEANYSGFVYDLGVQYEYELNQAARAEDKQIAPKKISIGLSGNAPQPVRVTTREVIGRNNPNYTGTALDTIFTVSDATSKTSLPAGYNLGATYSVTGKSLIGFNIEQTFWSQYENPIRTETLSDSWKASIGGEIIPDARSYNKYWKRVHYRFGAYYGADARTFSGTQIRDYGMTFGLGMPIAVRNGLPSFLNLGFQVGQNGHPDLITDTYFRVNLGFMLGDNSWFYKRKYK